jgi:hypothetical protein
MLLAHSCFFEIFTIENVGSPLVALDFEFLGRRTMAQSVRVETKGHGMFLHSDPVDRPNDIYAGTRTLVSDAGERSYLLLHVIPSRLRALILPKLI